MRHNSISARRVSAVSVAVQNQRRKNPAIATVPLDSGARPVLGEASRGRVDGFLDPVASVVEVSYRCRPDSQHG